MTVSRIFTNICSDDLKSSRDFYMSLLALQVQFESDWYIQMRSLSQPACEFGIISRTHSLVPADFQHRPQGFYITFVVEDVDDVFDKAKTLGVEIVQAPRDEFYGQRRLLMVDPGGCLVDVSAPN